MDPKLLANTSRVLEFHRQCPPGRPRHEQSRRGPRASSRSLAPTARRRSPTSSSRHPGSAASVPAHGLGGSPLQGAPQPQNVPPPPPSVRHPARGHTITRQAPRFDELRGTGLGEWPLRDDNGEAERQIRPLKLGEKNYLFAGSQNGAADIALARTLINTCHRSRTDPLAVHRRQHEAAARLAQVPYC